MPVLPIPMIIALMLFALLVLRIVRGETHVTLLALIAACAVEGAIFALVQYYGVSILRPVQAVLATVIPPVAWFAFIRASGGEGRPHAMAWHTIGPALAILCLVVNPMLLDVLIPLSFTIYGVVMLARLWGGEDSLLHSPLESGAGALMAWRVVALALIASAACDVVIAYGLAHGYSGVLLWMPSLVSSLSLLSLGALSLSSAVQSRRGGDEVDQVKLSEEDQARDQSIVAQLDRLMSEQKPFLDPDLTLARLARKLVVPAKQLSIAINRMRQENVSRYVNRQRIEHASQLLASGAAVTAVIYDSGFNTKSNFNREFLRVKGKSPSQWLADVPG